MIQNGLPKHPTFGVFSCDHQSPQLDYLPGMWSFPKLEVPLNHPYYHILVGFVIAF